MKERPHEGRIPLNGSEVVFDTRPKRLIAFQRPLAQSMRLDVIPDELIGIKIRRIDRQEVQLETAAAPLNVTRDKLGDMRGVPISDQKHRIAPSAHEGAEEFEKPRGIEPPAEGPPPEVSSRRHRRDGIDGLPLAARGHYRGLSPQRPRPARWRVRAYAGLIQKEDLRPSTAGASSDGRIILALPLLDRFRVALVRTPQRFLRRDAKSCQQPA